jgi:hypothetical protein
VNIKIYLFLVLFTLLLPSGILRAQSEINAPLQIPLYHPTNEGASDATKWGIYLSIGGGAAPALFELDTGGTGFYAAYATNSASPWWGTDVVTNNPVNGTNAYESGLTYYGASVFSSVTFWGNQTTSIFSSSNNLLVGQSTSIVEIKTNSLDGNITTNALWTNTGEVTHGTPPIQGAFYGDFGLALQSSSNALVNLIAQMQFTNGVVPGFVVHAPLNGTNGYLQIGLHASQTNTPGYNYFTMNPDTSGGTFSNTQISYKAEALISSTLNIQDHGTSIYATNIDLIADTGAHPNLHYSSSNPPATLTDKISDGILTNDLSVTFTATDTSGSNITLQNFTTSTNGGNSEYDRNRAEVMSAPKSDGSSYNTGLFFFNQHDDVIYDLQNGTVGLSPFSVPEPSEAWLLLTGLGLFLLWKILFPTFQNHT